MIEVSHLTKTYGARTAVDGISFAVPRGAVLGFLGPNGAGKSTTMRMLACLALPTSGRAVVAGFDVEDDAERVRASLGYLPEANPLYDEMTVEGYLLFMAGAKGLRGAARKSAVGAAVEKTDLARERRRILGNLSKGTRQRVGLGQALLGNPPVLILDEPTAGLDPAQITGIRTLIGSLRGTATVIVSTHILGEVEMTCSHVAIINRGRLAGFGTPREIATAARGAREIHLRVRGDRDAVAAAVAAAMPGAAIAADEAVADGARTLRLTLARDSAVDPAALSRGIVGAGLDLLELRETGTTLEEAYLAAVARAEDGPR